MDAIRRTTRNPMQAIARGAQLVRQARIRQLISSGRGRPALGVIRRDDRKVRWPIRG